MWWLLLQMCENFPGFENGEGTGRLVDIYPDLAKLFLNNRGYSMCINQPG
jgi:hypothetical protein